MSVRITFYGAAQTVTGSKYLLESARSKVLVDCGLFQGHKELRLRNWAEPPFDVEELDAVVITHAHVDHAGYLPLIVRRGYRGPVYCTAATKELLKLLLPDTARLQEEEARFANKRGSSKHRPALPLFGEADAAQALKQLRPLTRSSAAIVAPGVSVTTRCSGHILGSASLHFELDGRRVSFSGDVGRYAVPILPDPEGAPGADLLLCEATYGGRRHSSADIESELAGAVHAAYRRGGPLLIPAFAIGRTQTLLYYLAKLEREERIPACPVFVDSPMAIDATLIYRSFREEYDEEAAAILTAGNNVMMTSRTVFCRSVDESKKLNHLSGPRIIIAGSGMITGGRILHHLMRWLGDEQTTLLFVGYQAAGTRGQLIQSGAKEIKIFGSFVPIRAAVETISGLSAHADEAELVRWLKSGSSPARIKIVHGEPDAVSAMERLLRTQLDCPAAAAEDGESLEL